jgi:probable rRNA maturation factor
MLNLNIIYERGEFVRLASRAQLRRWVVATVASSSTSGDISALPTQINLVFAEQDQAKSLNMTHRGKRYATNVLTFSYSQNPAHADIIICLDVIEAEAREQGKLAKHHLGHMVVHGVLHALGHEHETEAQSATMESLEVKILKRFRIPDPYTVR